MPLAMAIIAPACPPPMRFQPQASVPITLVKGNCKISKKEKERFPFSSFSWYNLTVYRNCDNFSAGFCVVIAAVDANSRTPLIARIMIPCAVMGMLRWNYFWDSIPFLNRLYVPDGYTHHGVGSELLRFWEGEMKKQGHARVFTSTMSRENGQHFFRKFGYRDIGNVYDEGEGLELILAKRF